MSPNINSFVGDLVAMAQAVEELPKVQQELFNSRQENSALHQTVQDRELSIISYKQQIEDLNSKVRSLEVERDDASFRVLEAEDKAHNVLAMAKAARVSLEQMTGLLDLPKPEPEAPKAVPIVEAEAKPTELPSQAIGEGSSGQGSNQGSSEVNPTITIKATPTEEAPNSANPTASSTTTLQSNAVSSATNQDTASGTSTSEAGPYSGKRYYDYPTFINLEDWLDGGGLERDYYWRPGREAGF